MEIIELTSENIDTYLDQCGEVQKYLVSRPESIDAEQFKRTAAADNYFIALLDGDRVAGLGVMNKIIHPVRSNGYVDNIVVHPNYRGQGLFKLIMDELESKAKELGMYSVKLTCSRAEVQPLYERRNYIEKVDTKYYEKNL